MLHRLNGLKVPNVRKLVDVESKSWTIMDSLTVFCLNHQNSLLFERVQVKIFLSPIGPENRNRWDPHGTPRDAAAGRSRGTHLALGPLVHDLCV